jgi:hypothetical protein
MAKDLVPVPNAGAADEQFALTRVVIPKPDNTTRVATGAFALDEVPKSVQLPDAASQLERWVVDCRSRFEMLRAERASQNLPDHFVAGAWTVAYSVVGTFTAPSPRQP